MQCLASCIFVFVAVLQCQSLQNVQKSKHSFFTNSNAKLRTWLHRLEIPNCQLRIYRASHHVFTCERNLALSYLYIANGIKGFFNGLALPSPERTFCNFPLPRLLYAPSFPKIGTMENVHWGEADGLKYTIMREGLREIGAGDALQVHKLKRMHSLPSCLFGN